MLIRATRTLSALTVRALLYALLFVVVVLVHLSITGALRAQGWSGAAALLGSGAAVLGLVLAAVNLAEWLRERREAHLEMLRLRLGLPGGPCCVIWRAAESEAADEAMPWDVAGALRARYPKLARRLGVEGLAIVEFEISAQGAAKNISCVYAWPSDLFYTAAREALALARFEPKPDVHVRFGASYRMPFVFRISGATKLRDPGRRARTFRPALHAVQQAAGRLRAIAAAMRR